jgi:hypothetical protein
MFEKSVRGAVEKRIRWIREKGSKQADTSTLQAQIRDMEGLLERHSSTLGKGASTALQKQISGLKKKMEKSGGISYEEELRLLTPYFQFVENNPGFNRQRKTRDITKPKTSRKAKSSR